ncbi:MAG: hypothetical protein QY871_04960 [Dehalococcoides mccartyi]|uniref:hypothetical protein n=1 Tax=Dehalococcoides mccartyi TaxID=61435 RepID=UPI0025C99919|nr:hypothetical protein [Dehalococcoides mccartyi]MDN4186406.1 hypothetical protein [Dehalococcoides mccartyi]
MTWTNLCLHPKLSINNLAWFMEGEIISQWARDGFEISIPTSVVLSNPPFGFVKGNYEVKVYLNTEEKISCEFSIY